MPRTTAALTHSTGDQRDQVQFRVAFKIVLVARLWRARFAQQMKSLDQTDARWSALYMIADAEKGINQTNLADRLGVSGPTLVRLLDSLEADGLVERAAVAGDRRAKLVLIKEAGRKTLAEVDIDAARMRKDLFSGVSDNDLDATLRVLRHLSTQLDPDGST
jgi:MarR family transcriptional regulator, transcriptional regulator for hemolysin